MRWNVALIGAVVLWLAAGVPAWAAAEPVRVLVDDLPLTLTPPPAVQDGILYLPLRPLAQHFQASLAIDRQTIEVRRADGPVFTVRLGRLEVWSEGVVVAVIEAPVLVVNGATMIPRGAVDVLFDTLTVWNYQDGVVTIVSPQQPVQITTTPKPPSAVAREVARAAGTRSFEPEFRPEIERPVIASGYVTLGLGLGGETTATGRLQFRTHEGEDRLDGTVAVFAGASSLTSAGTVTLRRPESRLTIGGLSVHDSPLTIYEQGLLGFLYQTRRGTTDARIFGGNIPGTSSHVYGLHLALEPVGAWLLQGTTLYDPATGMAVLKARADRRLRAGLSGFAEAAWGGSLGGSGTAWRAGFESGSAVFTTTVSYLSLAPGFATIGNAALFSGRSGPMIQLSYRPAQNLAFSTSAAWLRGAPGVPDRTVTSLLANYRPTPRVGLVGEVRSVDDTTSGIHTTSTSAQAALTFTSGRWGLVLAGSQLANANISLGTTGTTSTFSLRTGYTLLNGLPIWGEVARSYGDTTSWAYGVGWTFRAGSALDLHLQLRHKIYTLPSAYDESSLEVGVLRPLASGAQLTLGGGIRYVSTSAASSPYLALQYGYPVYTYGSPQTGRLAAVMFVDRNGNGLRDADEPGVGGVVLRINDKTAAVSDQEGGASVSGVLAGEASAALDEETIPAHLVALQPAQTVRVAATQTAQVTFALAPAAAISGLVFIDQNNNGLRDPGERGVAGAVLRLLGTDVFRTSDVDGSFEFAHLAPGEYTLVVDQRALLNGYKVRGDGTYVISVQAGGAMAIEIPLLEGKTIIRTFP